MVVWLLVNWLLVFGLVRLVGCWVRFVVGLRWVVRLDWVGLVVC